MSPGKRRSGLSDAVLAHGVVIRDARKGRGQRDAGRGQCRRAELLHDGENMLAAREAHLQIDLGELKLAVGALILIAEAARNLEVAVEARDHQDLLEDLRRLRQGIKLARMHAAGHQEIARAFGRGLGQGSAFRFREIPGRCRLSRMARVISWRSQKLRCISGAAQVDVAILEPHFFVLDGLFRRRKRRQPRVVENAQFGGLDLNFAGGHLGIDGVLVAQAHLADGGDHVLRPHLLALGVPFGREFFVEHDLGNAAAVAHVEEDQVAVIAAPVNPAHQHHLFACVGGAQVRRTYGCVQDCLRKSSTADFLYPSYAHSAWLGQQNVGSRVSRSPRNLGLHAGGEVLHRKDTGLQFILAQDHDRARDLVRRFKRLLQPESCRRPARR